MERFWETTPLLEMTTEQWESLCDHCAKCCFEQLEDEDTGELYPTENACRYLDKCSGKCTDYANRKKNVPECGSIDRQRLLNGDYYYLPETCAYVLLANNQPLPSSHPLVKK